MTTLARPTWRCLRCGGDTKAQGVCCRDCRMVATVECVRLVESWREQQARLADRQRRLLYRRPPDDRRAPQPVTVQQIDPSARRTR
jgi:hypothetical protein